MVTYHNPQLKDTFGPQGVKARKIVLNYSNAKKVEVDGEQLKGKQAKDVREGIVERIDVFFS